MSGITTAFQGVSTAARVAGTAGRLGTDAARIAQMTSGGRQQGPAPGGQTAAGQPKGPPTAAEKRAQERAERAARPAYMPLNEIAAWMSRYVVASPAMIDAMVLLAAQTWVCDTETLATTPRALWVGKDGKANCGKTNAMNVTFALCYSPEDTDGSWPSVVSGLAGVSGEGRPCPTLYFDEIQTIFGPGGTRGQSHPLGKVLRKGYKRNGKMAWSVDRSKVDFSIFSTFLMTGLANAVPYDIRTRCVVWEMEPGTPELYFDARDAEAQAESYAEVMGAWVKSYRKEIKAFRGRSLGIATLTGRRLEIWEAMFAVASCAGQAWLNRCYTAFCELALDESDQPKLTPNQQIIRDLADATVVVPWLNDTFVSALALVDELKRSDNPLYDGRTDGSLARMIGDALPFQSRQKRFGGNPVHVYRAADITGLWDAMRPEDPMDVELTPDVNQYEVFDNVEEDDDETADLVSA
jgi:Protein of unknown function (DUF3631)